jgi:hypothetical protein
MHTDSRRLAGILLIIFPTVVFGGVSILSLLINDPQYILSSLTPTPPSPSSISS